MGFLHGSMGKESASNAGDTGDMGSILGSGRIPGGGKWQPTPVSLPEKSYGQRSLAAGYSPKGCKESDTPEWLHTHEHKSYMHTIFPLSIIRLCYYFIESVVRGNRGMGMTIWNCQGRWRQRDRRTLVSWWETWLLHQRVPFFVWLQDGELRQQWATAAGTVGISPGIQNKFSCLFLTTWCRK